jgi:hypothetical protein
MVAAVSNGSDGRDGGIGTIAASAVSPQLAAPNNCESEYEQPDAFNERIRERQFTRTECHKPQCPACRYRSWR